MDKVQIHVPKNYRTLPWSYQTFLAIGIRLCGSLAAYHGYLSFFGHSTWILPISFRCFACENAFWGPQNADYDVLVGALAIMGV